jgi:hypothetical protein
LRERFSFLTRRNAVRREKIPSPCAAPNLVLEGEILFPDKAPPEVSAEAHCCAPHK